MVLIHYFFRCLYSGRMVLTLGLLGLFCWWALPGLAIELNNPLPNNLFPANAHVTSGPARVTGSNHGVAQSVFQDGESDTNQGHRVVINIPSRTLRLYQGQVLVKQYPVGVGRPGFMTPLGQHQVIRKIKNPGWENPYKPRGQMQMGPGRDNPLGTRWIGFKQDARGEYGIHGTNRPSSVGQYSSHGCVRMLVKDAEDLYDRVPMGAPVEVTYDLIQTQLKNNQIMVSVFADRFNRGKPTLQHVVSRVSQQYPGAKINTTLLKQALVQAKEMPVTVGLLQNETVASSP